jgi:hypothetical protein
MMGSTGEEPNICDQESSADWSKQSFLDQGARQYPQALTGEAVRNGGIDCHRTSHNSCFIQVKPR